MSFNQVHKKAEVDTNLTSEPIFRNSYYHYKSTEHYKTWCFASSPGVLWLIPVYYYIFFSPIFSRKSQKFTKIAFWMKNRSSWKNKVNGEVMWKRLKLRRKKIRQLSLTTPKRHYFWLYFLLSLLFSYWGIYIQNGFHRKFWEIYHT